MNVEKINKKKLCDDFDLDYEKPLFIYIGRLVGEKAAELLPPAINKAFETLDKKVNFLILGSGDPAVEKQLESETFKLPKLELKNTSIFNLKFEDFNILEYNSSPTIKAELSN